MNATHVERGPRSAPWGAVSLGIAFIALLAYLPSWGTSTLLGLLGGLFALPGLRSRDRSRALAWTALIVNAGLLASFVWLLHLYDWG